MYNKVNIFESIQYLYGMFSVISKYNFTISFKKILSKVSTSLHSYNAKVSFTSHKRTRLNYKWTLVILFCGFRYFRYIPRHYHCHLFRRQQLLYSGTF